MTEPFFFLNTHGGVNPHTQTGPNDFIILLGTAKNEYGIDSEMIPLALSNEAICKINQA